VKLLATLAGLAIASLAATSSDAEVVTNEKADFSIVLTSPCNGELVTLEGTAQYVIHVTADGNGGSHLDIHGNTHLRGPGAATGTRYLADEQFHTTINLNAGAYESTITDTFRLIAQGEAPNFMVSIDYHITMNAEGTVTVERLGTRADCK